jgi:hypothetical protein
VKGAKVVVPTADELDAMKGRVLVATDRLFVKLLSAPHYYEEEVVPGISKGEWRALAQVNDYVCVIEVRIS